jgi:hypothetical protein
VGNLPKPLDYHTSNLETRDLFRDLKVILVSELLGSGRELGSDSRWYVFVDLSSAEEATKAVNTLSGIRMWSRNIEVNTASGVPRKALQHILDAR